MRLLRFALFFPLLVLVFLALGLGWLAVRPLPLASERISFNIPPGAGLSEASLRIENAGAGMPSWQFTLIARALGHATRLKAGTYEAERGLSALDLLDKLVRGDVALTKVTLIDGKTFREIRAQLDAHPDLRHDTRGKSEREILDALQIAARSAEGQFLPETYLVGKGASDLDVLAEAHAALRRALDQAWNARSESLPLASPQELLTLASVVERETGLAADRGPIASVFLNRLRIGMPLQSDPTVIFGLGERFDGNLRRIDLTTDTPWNTYTRPGLPPTPIGLAGLASLAAVSQPPTGPALYFVARGDGSSEFSTTLEQHNRAVARYQRGVGR